MICPFDTGRAVSRTQLSYQPQEAVLFSCSLRVNSAGTSLTSTLEAVDYVQAQPIFLCVDSSSHISSSCYTIIIQPRINILVFNTNPFYKTHLHLVYSTILIAASASNYDFRVPDHCVNLRMIFTGNMLRAARA